MGTLDGRSTALWFDRRFDVQADLSFQKNVKNIPTLRETHGKSGRSNSRLRVGITHCFES